MYLDGCLLVLIAIAVYTDLRYRRISNLIIGGGLLIAFSGHYYTQGITGLAFGLKGLGVGLALLLVPFLLGGMGAGDVKLLGVIGAFKGSSFSVSVFLWMALWGGAMAIVLLLIKGQLLATIKRVRQVLNPKLGLLGIVITMHNSRTSLSTQVEQELQKHFGRNLFDSIIPRNVRLAEAPSHGKPILYYDRFCRGASAYKKLSREIATRAKL